MLYRVSRENGAGISAAEQAKVLYERWILDIPKLMDIAVLYGRKNPGLTRRLLEQVSLFCVCFSVCLLYEMLINRCQQSSAECSHSRRFENENASHGCYVLVRGSPILPSAALVDL